MAAGNRRKKLRDHLSKHTLTMHGRAGGRMESEARHELSKPIPSHVLPPARLRLLKGP